MKKRPPIRDLSHQPVSKSKDGKSIYIRIPPSLAETISATMGSGCQCQYCKEHPREVSRWDTLCVSADGTGRTWIIHNPSF